MASDVESVTVAMGNQTFNEKDAVKNGDEAVKNGEVVSSNSGKEIQDAGGFGETSGTGGLNSGYARMPVERDAVKYNMNHPSRGHCVIFNHRYFASHTGLSERNGTDRDRDQAKQLFSYLGFNVTVHDNLTVERIKEAIQDLAFGVDHTDFDTLVIVFMSHGEQEILYGYNGSFKADILFDSFNADQCKSLAGKPKIFFIQACRGEQLDPGTTLVSTGPKDEIDAGTVSLYKIPNSTDFLTCWSTVSGHYSWRNTTNGSWFIQSLVHVLRSQCQRDDLLSMMTDVNRFMIINFESNCPSQQHMHGKKQVANIVSTLMRKIYLTPKY